MNLTVEQTPTGVKIPLTAFAEAGRLEVVIEADYALVRPVPEVGSRFSIDPRRAQMQKEVTAFEAQHTQLVETHLGQHVAFHKGELVDADKDRRALRQRIRNRYGRAVVMIQQVDATLPSPLRLGSLRNAGD